MKDETNSKESQILEDLILWGQCLGEYDSPGKTITPELQQERLETIQKIEAKYPGLSFNQLGQKVDATISHSLDLKNQGNPDVSTTRIGGINIKVNLDKLDREIEELRHKEQELKALEKQIKALRESILLQQQMLGTDTLETEQGTFYRRHRSNLKIEIPVAHLPQKYQAIAPDKDAIKEALQKGEYVAGCTIEQTEYLQIKWS